MTDPRGWIDRLPDELAPQARVLTRLVEAVEADPRIRALSLHGSVARGRADELSDLDTGIWIADDHYDAFLSELPSLARSLGATVDILFETPGSPYLFVQFADGVQLELSTGRASECDGRAEDELALVDPDGILARSAAARPPWDAELWLGWAWMNLYDVDKYLRREHVWKALLKLNSARDNLLRHHAKTVGAVDPRLGLTSILDAGHPPPPRLGETVAGLDPGDVRRAAVATAELLLTYDRRPFAELVLARLS